MKKIYILVFFLFLGICLSQNFLFAQKIPTTQAITYTFTASAPAGAFVYNVSPNIIVSGDVEYYNSGAGAGPYGIGFTFYVDCVPYTQFNVTSNGWMTLDPGSYDFHNVNNLNTTCCGSFGPGNERPIIAPLWDELHVNCTGGNNGNINYKLTGITPNQVLTVEWFRLIYGYNAACTTAPSMSFQVKLYEGNNEIKFIYKREAGGISGTPSASIGIGGQATGDYYTLNNTGAAPTASKVTNTMNLATRPATDQVYLWHPPSCSVPIELLSFTGKKLIEKNLLEWTTATEMNNDFFTIEKSDDGISYSELIRIKGAGNSSMNKNYFTTDDEPFPNLTYYRLKQTDFNGDFTYSSVISISDFPEVTISLTPNPAQNDMQLNFSSEKEILAQADIINSLGQCVISKSMRLSKGSGFLNFDVGILPRGIYLLKFGNSFFQKQIKFLKL